MYKYKLLEFMRKLPHEQFYKVKSSLPVQLGISPDTFRQWMYIKTNSARMIPAESLMKLALFFEKDITEMFNEVPTKPEIEFLTQKEIDHVDSED